MFGRKANRIKELQDSVSYFKRRVSIELEISRKKQREINDKNEIIENLEKMIVTLKADISLFIQERNNAAQLTIINNPEWIDGEPKTLGWYFVATDEWAEPGYYTTALFYNPAARCRWMRGDQGNSERFEGEVVAHIKAPEYK